VDVGVLGLQGDFAAHAAAIERLGGAARIVKKPDQLQNLDGLIIPGGESTTLIKLMDLYAFWEPLEAFVASGRSVLGTCAGAIILATEVLNPPQRSLGAIDIAIERNSYGRQLESFETTGRFTPDKDATAVELEMVFIRAPRILRLGSRVRALAEHDGECVMARQERVVVASFHPELTDDATVHRYFMQL